MSRAAPGPVSAELNATGKLIVGEIINANTQPRDRVLDTVQARRRHLSRKVA